MNNKINYWTIPCNINYYDIINAFNDLNNIEWKQYLNNIQPGDIVYIYVGAPYSKMMYKCKVNKVNLNKITIDDRKYWPNSENYGKFDRYMEIELLKKYDDTDYYHYSNLKLNGFINQQGQSSATEQLVNYLENKYNKKL